MLGRVFKFLREGGWASYLVRTVIVLCIAPFLHASDLQVEENSNTLIFVDSSIKNYREILSDQHPNSSIFIIDEHVDGIDQISDVLSRYSEISDIHVISHGAPGRLMLGSSQLDSEGVTARKLSLIHI